MQTELLIEDATVPHESNDTLKIGVSLVEITDLDEVGRIWTDLQARSDHSFFISWGWIGCWLSQLPVSVRPQLLIAESQSEVVGLGCVSRKRIRRGKVIPSNALFLHETGDSVYDSLTIEHNGFLAAHGVEGVVQRAIINFLCDECPDWDELFLPGIDVESPLAQAVQEERPGVRFRTVKQSPCCMVDLVKLKGLGKDFCSSLGSSTRASIRKSVRLYEERGPLSMHAARDVDDALRIFDELKTLHRASWESRGDSGAFSHDWIDGFHRHLIETRFSYGEIQLLQFKAGAHTIGCLYNFVLDGQVSFYQSGFQYEDNAKAKPGLVCHTLAIEFNREQGAHTYDFLAGDSQYKRSLGEEVLSAQWGVLQRNRFQFRIEDLLRAARRCIRF